MALTGGISFYKRSKVLIDDETTITATSGSEAADFAIDRNTFTYWRSVGSSDSVTETIIITPPADVVLDRIFLIDHNFETFTVKYKSGGVFVDFTNVTGLDGALGGGITETTYARDTAYYEFDSVTTSAIEITCTTAQVTDAEKFISQIIATEELGTLEGYPIVKSVKPSRNSRIKRTLTGRRNVLKSIETTEFQLDFKDYPRSLSDDLDLMFDLQDSEDPFLVWLSGGRFGSDFFGYTLPQWKLKAVTQMQVIKNLDNSYSKNVYQNSVNVKVGLAESV